MVHCSVKVTGERMTNATVGSTPAVPTVSDPRGVAGALSADRMERECVWKEGAADPQGTANVLQIMWYQVLDISRVSRADKKKFTATNIFPLVQ